MVEQKLPKLTTIKFLRVVLHINLLRLAYLDDPQSRPSQSQWRTSTMFHTVQR